MKSVAMGMVMSVVGIMLLVLMVQAISLTEEKQQITYELQVDQEIDALY